MVVTCAKVYVKILSPTNDLLEDRILSVRMQGNSRDGIQTSMDLMRKCKSVELSSVFQKEICGVLDAGLKNNVLKCEKQIDSFLDHEINCLFVSSQNGVTVKMGTLQFKHLRTPGDFVSEGSGAASLPVRLADAAAPMAWDASLSTHRETPLSTHRETPLSRQRDTPRSSQRGSPAPVPAHAESHALPLTETRSRSRDAPVF